MREKKQYLREKDVFLLKKEYQEKLNDIRYEYEEQINTYKNRIHELEKELVHAKHQAKDEVAKKENLKS